MSYGHFDDARRAYVITDPLTPTPWINYLTNKRLSAFISQNAGGLVWHMEPLTRRISRYHYIPAPADRPGFYLYIKDKTTGELWNPHFAPTCNILDKFECRHEPGITTFLGEKDGLRVEVTYSIPPDDDVMLWHVTLSNLRVESADVQVTSYLEFGLLEYLREMLAWCYLKGHIGFNYHPETRSIRYDYHVFEAPVTPRMAFACTAEVSGYDCSRDKFIGRTGSLAAPEALTKTSLSNSTLPSGDHGAGVLGVEQHLAPGESVSFAYQLIVADTWEEVETLLARYAQTSAVEKAIASTRNHWAQQLSTLHCQTGDATVDRFINTWLPYNNLITLGLARIISTDQMGLDGLKYRDTTQDALGVSSIDPTFSRERMELVFAHQKNDGGGCYGFYPFTPGKAVDEEPHRSDNTVWQIYTIKNLLAETGDWDFLDKVIPYRDGGEASVYQHTLLGLQHIADRCGPHGLPTLFYADWNDSLALFGDEKAESVMLGMQLVHSCHEMAELATRVGKEEDARWCQQIADELTCQLNSDEVWDGKWYRRLLMSDGSYLGSDLCRQGKIFVNPQSWSVISGVGAVSQRGILAMDSVAELLDTEYGVRLLSPPYLGIPEPEDPPLGSCPGVNENASIFCHANTWAIIAECLLKRPERAFKYFGQILPEVVAQRAGYDHYGREPYVCVSSIVGPANEAFGRGGISWLTGTASWMYVAATQYLLGIRPSYQGLALDPCLPAALPKVQVQRQFRGCRYDITLENHQLGSVELEIDRQKIAGNVLPLPEEKAHRVICRF